VKKCAPGGVKATDAIGHVRSAVACVGEGSAGLPHPSWQVGDDYPLLRPILGGIDHEGSHQGRGRVPPRALQTVPLLTHSIARILRDGMANQRACRPPGHHHRRQPHQPSPPETRGRRLRGSPHHVPRRIPTPLLSRARHTTAGLAMNAHPQSTTSLYGTNGQTVLRDPATTPKPGAARDPGSGKWVTIFITPDHGAFATFGSGAWWRSTW
jgi:hypothetical protein